MSICANIGSLTHEILIVDNASYDGCEEMLRSEFPHVIFIQSNHNLGFAGANNLAFTRSSGRNILFLNPDTEIQGAAIQELVLALECLPDAGMVGARLLNSDGSLQTTCITAIPIILNQTLNSRFLRRVLPCWKIWGMRPLFEDTTAPASVEAISGACMLARREVIQRLGGFRTDYFMYAEDMDLCLSITQAGWKIYYVPDAAIVHHAGGSSAFREESNFSNIMLRQSVAHFFTIHRGPLYASLYRASLTVVSAMRIFILLISFPILIRRWNCRSVSLALNKWFSILLWSLGNTRWATRQSLVSKRESAVVTNVTNPYTAGYSIDDRFFE